MPTPYSSGPISFIEAIGSNSVYALIRGIRWEDTEITYSFPATNSRWSSDPFTGYGPGEEPWRTSFKPISPTNQSDFIHALQQWQNIADIQFRFIEETPNAVGDIRIAYTEIPSLDHAEAWTYLPAHGVWGGDIWVNKSSNSAEREWSTGSFSFVTILHEIGHALGLEHPFEDPAFPLHEDTMSSTIMSYSAIPGNQNSFFDFYPTTPMPLDIRALQLLYGTNTTFHNEDNTYDYTDLDTYHETIWDSGGIDTINYTGQQAAFIQLEEGQGSTIGNPVHAINNFGNRSVPNIWVSYDTVIENASGGQGNDTLYGNAYDNILSGNNGNDDFMGMAGNDTFLGGSGIDTVLLAGMQKEYSLNKTEDGFAITHLTEPNDQDQLINIERLSFNNTGLALDIEGRTGQLVKLLGVISGAASINNRDLITTGLSYIDSGIPDTQLADVALTAIGVHSHDEIVTLLWHNLFGDDPTREEKQTYINLLDDGVLSAAELTLIAAETSLNLENINYASLLQTGIEFNL